MTSRMEFLYCILETILGHEVTFKMKTLAKDDRAEN